MERGGREGVLQWGRNNFLVSSAVTKDEERKRTGLSQSFLDTRRSFSLSCEKLPDNGPRQTERPSDLYGIKGVSHTYVQMAPAACVCAPVPTKPPCSTLPLSAPPWRISTERPNLYIVLFDIMIAPCGASLRPLLREAHPPRVLCRS